MVWGYSNFGFSSYLALICIDAKVNAGWNDSCGFFFLYMCITLNFYFFSYFNCVYSTFLYYFIVLRSLVIYTRLGWRGMVLYLMILLDLMEESVEIWLATELVEVVWLFVKGLGLVLRWNDGVSCSQKSSFSRFYVSNLRLNASSAREWPDSSIL